MDAVTDQVRMRAQLSGWCGRLHHDLAKSFSRRACWASHAEDALQELWLSLLDSPPPADVASNPDRLRAWLTGAARNLLIDQIRREARRRQVPLPQVAADESEPLGQLERHESEFRVRDTLARMRGGRGRVNARILEMRYAEGRSVKEIAERLGMSPRDVSVRLQRAKRRFRRMWAQRGGGARKTRGDLSSARRFKGLQVGHFLAPHSSESNDYQVRIASHTLERERS
jgi:RNA polymerase sigma factor (sigma-70 family)